MGLDCFSYLALVCHLSPQCKSVELLPTTWTGTRLASRRRAQTRSSPRRPVRSGQASCSQEEELCATATTPMGGGFFLAWARCGTVWAALEKLRAAVRERGETALRGVGLPLTPSGPYCRPQVEPIILSRVAPTRTSRVVFCCAFHPVHPPMVPSRIEGCFPRST
jgi:hypothetical protein